MEEFATWLNGRMWEALGGGFVGGFIYAWVSDRIRRRRKEK